MLGDSNLDILTKLSDEVVSHLSKSVVSLALSKGNTVLFACSGIAIERQGHVTRFLTLASFVTALNDKKKIHGNLKIEVRQGGSEVHKGFLAEYNLDQNFAVVNIMTPLDVHVVLLKCAEENLPHSNVVAVGREISGTLIARSVILAVCCEGGPLFDFDGNFVGMNVILVKERTFFVPWRAIIKQLEDYWSPLQKKKCVPHLKVLKATR
ncbi:hypothetical protein EJB05_18920, partial [Eragrostis curvula]